MQTCYRHPDEPAGVICQRCDRPICPKCMHQASVGFHCPECVKSGKQKVIQGTAAFVSQPLITQILIGVNVAMFVIGCIVDKAFNVGFGGGSGSWETHFALFARFWEHGSNLYIVDVPGSHVVGVGAGQVYRLVTAGFMHAGLLHLAMNMYALWILGRVTEHLAGRWRFAVIYVVALLAGGLGAILLSPNEPTVGASGAIFGLMGAIFVAQRAQGIPFGRSPLLPVLILNLVFTFGVPGISIGGHIGGLVGGAAAGWLVLDFGPRPGIDKRLPYLLCGLVAVACVVAAVMYSSGYVPHN